MVIDLSFKTHLGEIIYSDNKLFVSFVKKVKWSEPIEIFTNSPLHKNANIANFVLAVPFKINKTNEVCNLEM